MSKRSEVERLGAKLDALLDLDKTCDLEQFYDGKKWRALLRAALMNPVPPEELKACGTCRSCKRQKAIDRAKRRILGDE